MENIDLIKRYDVLKSNRSVVEGLWQEIEHYVVPFRGDFFKEDITESDVQWRKRWIYDSTAVEAAQSLAASIHGSLTSPVTRWYDMRFRSDNINSIKEAKGWLEEVADVIFYALQESNFNLEVSEMYLDLVGFGNSIITEEIEGTYEKYEGLDFKAVPVKEGYFEQDTKGQIINFYRKLSWTYLQIVDKFGVDKVPDTIKKKAESHAAVDEKTEVIFCVWKRKPEEYADVDTTEPTVPAKRRPYGFKYILYKDKTTLGEEGGYYEMPAFVPRWRKTSGSQWGHSPSAVAMGDILTLNQLVAMILKAGEKVIDPPSLVNQRGVLGDIDLRSGGQTVVRGDGMIKPYESGARFDVSSLMKADLQAGIRRMFYVDQLELKESPAMTATEVQVRYELMQRLLGPTLGRLQSDFLDPLIQRTYMILARAGQLPPVPGVVSEMGANMDLEYLGPLARAQKMDQIVAVERWISSTMALSEKFPEILDIINPTKIGRGTAIMLSVPQKFQNSDTEIKKIRDDRSKQEQEMRMMAMMDGAGKGMESVGKGMTAIKEAGTDATGQPVQ